MKLISCHIENFGKLSDFDMDFKDGLNTVLEENGWGKTTLAAFIKAMFYGLESTMRGDITTNEKKRYMPHNGKHFGGEITFEAEGKEYVMTRDFDTKVKEQEFTLRDRATNLPSTRYTKNIGEELFGIDKDSFRRTVFINHDSIKYEGVDSSISARVSSDGQLSDIKNFDNADAKLEEYLKENRDKRGKDKSVLGRITSAISELEMSTANEPAVANSIDQLKKNLTQVKSEIAELEEEKKKINEAETKAAQLKEKKTRAKHLAELRQNLDEAEKSVEEKLQSFGEEVPEADKLDKISEQLSKVEKAENSLSSGLDMSDADSISHLRQIFKNGIPSEEEFDKRIESFNTIQGYIHRKDELETLIETEEDSMSQKLSKKGSRSIGASRVFLVFGILFILGGTILMNAGLMMSVPKFLLIGVIVMIVGFGLGAFPILSGRGSSAPAVKSTQMERYQQGIRDCDNNIKREEAYIKEFFEEHELSYSRIDAESLLYDMKAKAKNLRALEKKEEESSIANEKAEETFAAERNALTEMCSGVPGLEIGEGDIDYEQLRRNISSIRVDLTNYENATLNRDREKARLEEFLKDNPGIEDMVSDAAESDGLAETADAAEEKDSEARLTEIDGQLEIKRRAERNYESELENACEQADEISAGKERLEVLKNQKAELSEKCAIVDKTRGLLGEAKGRFTAKYMAPVKDAFDKYYDTMTASVGYTQSAEYDIDANMNIRRKEDGDYRDIRSLSDGYTDMIGLSIRMALCDAMYEKEKPVIILDDPFINIDTAKLPGAKKFLEEIAENYQVIYFTCHESRA